MKDLDMDQLSPNDRYFGLHNFGNTCYCNSVLQALFFCPPFRERVLKYRSERLKQGSSKKDTLLSCLCELFYSISSQKKKSGVLYPKKFIARLRKEYESFDNYAQHDAHELFNRLLNSIHLVLVEENKERERQQQQQQQLNLEQTKASVVKKERSSIFKRRKHKKQSSKNNVSDVTESMASIPDSTQIEDLSHNINDSSCKKSADAKDRTVNSTAAGDAKTLEAPSSQGSDAAAAGSSADNTWINEIFQGTFSTITRCLTCETVKHRDEDFLDLSIDIEQNTSITHCLRVFSNQQTLSGEHKYSCDVCRSKQEAQIAMRIKKLPRILALHLKRFKYCDSLNKYTKLSYRVVFPFELRLFNTTSDAEDSDRLYDLIAVIVHCGSGPHRGHYVSIVKSHGTWLLFDDDNVEMIEPSGMEDFFGISADKNSESGYILFYQCKE